MPHYDKRRGDLIIRIVYDGAPEAGKTTNVRQLSQVLSLQRRGELASPGTVGRRTEFFDWMDFAGGYLDGHRLRCQLVTVPGQASLLRRRRYLLETADAVIFVADSHPLLAEENRDTFMLLESALARSSDVPISIVLQANKQDRVNALPPQELARRMGVDPRTPALPARADQGEGVKEAFFLAVRLAAERVRALARHGPIGFATPELGESSEGLHEQMLARELDDAPIEPETDAPSPVSPFVSAPAPVPAPEVPVVASPPAPQPLALSLPDPAHTPAGCVWPPMTGRALCAFAHGGTATVSEGRRAWAPADALELQSNRALLLHTRPEWGWPSLDPARLALLAAIRALLPMRDVLPEDRAVVLGFEREEWRLWVITPDLPTLADDIHAALEDGGGDPAIIDRCMEAWRAVHGRLGARAATLGPAMVAKSRAGWVLVAFGDGLDRPATPMFSPVRPPPRGLLQRLEETGAWPLLHAELRAGALSESL